MNAFLMHIDRDFDSKDELPPNVGDLTQDLEIDMLLNAMASGDAFIFEVVKTALFQSLRKPESILYRQWILADSLNQPAMVRDIYAIATEAIDREKKIWGWMNTGYPLGTLHHSVDVLQLFVGLLRRLRTVAEECAPQCCSKGFNRLFAMLRQELSEEYLGVVENHLRTLEFRHGVLISAELGDGCKGSHYTLRNFPVRRFSWMDWLRSWTTRLTRRQNRADGYVYEVSDRDESGMKALSELKDRGIAQIATVLAESTDQILGFFGMLRTEIGFYVGCLNLHDRLVCKNEPICFPQPLAMDERAFNALGLYDVCLSLNVEGRTLGNDVSGDGKTLVMITGANRGGKSTFLRSVGLAQLMMQCGLFVAANRFCCNICDGLYTHFKRKEDASMNSGKLDEELNRMSALIDKVTRNSVVLLNESFAATNEREGSEIATQIVRALLERSIKVFYVTHMFELAQGFYNEQSSGAVFLRAERFSDGQRTFRLVEAAPLPTSFGGDLYARIFDPAHKPTTLPMDEFVLENKSR